MSCRVGREQITAIRSVSYLCIERLHGQSRSAKRALQCSGLAGVKPPRTAGEVAVWEGLEMLGAGRLGSGSDNSLRKHKVTGGGRVLNLAC
jgi:hypothetical protein